MPIQATEALIVSMFCISFLEGVWVMLLGTAIYLSRVRKHLSRQKDSRDWGLWACVLMFILSTAHFITTFYQYYGFMGGSNRFSETDLKAYARYCLAPAPIVYLTVIAAGLIMSWRVFHLYDGDWRVVVAPVLGTVTTAVLSFGYVGVNYKHINNLTGTSIEDVYALARSSPSRSWALSSIALSAVTTILLSGLIMVKLFAHQRSSREFSSFGADLLLILESGVIYACAWVIYLVVFLVGNNATLIVFDSIGQLAGIIPSLIIVLSSAGVSLVAPPMYTERRPSMPSARVESTMNFSARPQDTQFSISMGDSTELSTNLDVKKSKERLYVNS